MRRETVIGRLGLSDVILNAPEPDFRFSQWTVMTIQKKQKSLTRNRLVFLRHRLRIIFTRPEKRAGAFAPGTGLSNLQVCWPVGSDYVAGPDWAGLSGLLGTMVARRDRHLVELGLRSPFLVSRAYNLDGRGTQGPAATTSAPEDR